MCMASSATATQTIHSITSLFQSGWLPTDSSSIHPSLSFYGESPPRRRLLDYITFALGDTELGPADTTAILGDSVHFDSCMTLTAHVSQLVRDCFYQLRRIKTIRKFILTSAAVSLVNSFIVSRFDYCNSIYWRVTDVSAR